MYITKVLAVLLSKTSNVLETLNMRAGIVSVSLNFLRNLPARACNSTTNLSRGARTTEPRLTRFMETAMRHGKVFPHTDKLRMLIGLCWPTDTAAAAARSCTGRRAAAPRSTATRASTRARTTPGAAPTMTATSRPF